MKLQDFGKLGQPKLDQWLQQVFNWAQKKVSFKDNMDVSFQEVYISSSGSQIQHNLGRIPQGVIQVATQQNGTASITPTLDKPWTSKFIYLTRSSSGNSTLMIF